MKKYLFIAIATILAASCVDTYKPMDKDSATAYVMMSGTGNSAVTTLVADGNGSAAVISVTAASKVKEEVRIKIAISPEALTAYNKAHGTVFECVPEGSVELDTDELVIEKGKAVSSVASATFVDFGALEAGYTYAIPVTIVSVTGGEVVEASRTSIIRVSRTLRFACLNINNSGLSSNFLFAEPTPLANYTYEIMFNSANITSQSGDNPARLCAFEQADESLSCLLRFNEKTTVEGESNRSCKRLQVKNPGSGEIISATKFEEGNWYMLSITFDGSNVKLYVNGELDGTSPDSLPDGIQFGRFELGMSWGSGYPQSQLFNARVREIRVWDRALSATEIKAGLCTISGDADGLKGYWKMDEGQGHIFHNSATATGESYDMDWSQSVRDTGNGSLTSTASAATVVERQWIASSDEKNSCVL